jgi:hypothetical protein
LLFIREMAEVECLLLRNESLIDLRAVLKHQILEDNPHGRFIHVMYHHLI